MTDACHRLSLVVWGIPEAIPCGEVFRLKLGLKCEAACLPAGWSVALRDHEGREQQSLTFTAEICPGTVALHCVEGELRAPATVGSFAWTASVPAMVAGSSDGVRHAPATAGFVVRTVAAPELRLRVIAIDRAHGRPVAGARVVVHPYRAVTDAGGSAELMLPRGPYRLFVSGRDFLPLRSDGELVADTTVHAELDRDVGPSDAELWG
jgi:hypothetical protein